MWLVRSQKVAEHAEVMATEDGSQDGSDEKTTAKRPFVRI